MDADACRKACFEAERALAAYNASVAMYQDAARRRDWDHLEKLRFSTVSALECYLDCIAAGQRLLEGGQS